MIPSPYGLPAYNGAVPSNPGFLGGPMNRTGYPSPMPTPSPYPAPQPSGYGQPIPNAYGGMAPSASQYLGMPAAGNANGLPSSYVSPSLIQRIMQQRSGQGQTPFQQPPGWS